MGGEVKFLNGFSNIVLPLVVILCTGVGLVAGDWVLCVGCSWVSGKGSDMIFWFWDFCDIGGEGDEVEINGASHNGCL